MTSEECGTEAGEIAQLVKGLLCKHKDQSSIPRAYVKTKQSKQKPGVVVYIHLQSQCWECRDGQVPSSLSEVQDGKTPCLKPTNTMLMLRPLSQSSVAIGKCAGEKRARDRDCRVCLLQSIGSLRKDTKPRNFSYAGLFLPSSTENLSLRGCVLTNHLCLPRGLLFIFLAGRHT